MHEPSECEISHEYEVNTAEPSLTGTHTNRLRGTSYSCKVHRHTHEYNFAQTYMLYRQLKLPLNDHSATAALPTSGIWRSRMRSTILTLLLGSDSWVRILASVLLQPGTGIWTEECILALFIAWRVKLPTELNSRHNIDCPILGAAKQVRSVVDLSIRGMFKGLSLSLGKYFQLELSVIRIKYRSPRIYPRDF